MKKLPKHSSDIRDHFKCLGDEVIENDQLDSGALEKTVISLRITLNRLSQIDVLAEKFSMNRQAFILKILEYGVEDALGGAMDSFGKDYWSEHHEKIQQRYAELAEKLKESKS